MDAFGRRFAKPASRARKEFGRTAWRRAALAERLQGFPSPPARKRGGPVNARAPTNVAEYWMPRWSLLPVKWLDDQRDVNPGPPSGPSQVLSGWVLSEWVF